MKPSDCAPNSPPLTIVLHIPKTAGTSLREEFRTNLKPEEWAFLNVPFEVETDLGHQDTTEAQKKWVAQTLAQRRGDPLHYLFGHWAYFGVDELLPDAGEPRYITFLREPVERVISMYFFSRREPNSLSHREIHDNNWSLEDWFQNSQNVRRFNGQLRHLLLGSDATLMARRDLERADLEEGLRRLQAMWFVGLTEKFNDDALFLRSYLGFRPRPQADAANRGTNKKPVDGRVKAQIAAANRFDLELYAAAQRLHQTFFQTHAELWAQFQQKDARHQRVERLRRPLRPLKRALQRWLPS